jgi:hypothetical protein
LDIISGVTIITSANSNEKTINGNLIISAILLFVGKTKGKNSIELVKKINETNIKRFSRRERSGSFVMSDKKANMIQPPIAENIIAATLLEESLRSLKNITNPIARHNKAISGAIIKSYSCKFPPEFL